MAQNRDKRSIILNSDINYSFVHVKPLYYFRKDVVTYNVYYKYINHGWREVYYFRSKLLNKCEIIKLRY